jgi:hypothetical protein
MARYAARTIQGHLARCNNMALTAQQRGASFEDLASYIFSRIPGIGIVERDEMNVFANEEIDIALWNERAKLGLSFLSNIILIECKNWYNPVSSIEVAWFAQKLVSRGLDFGILIANNGITGNAAQLTASHNIISQHLAQKRKIIVITREDIETLTETSDLVTLIKQKLCRLAVSGRIN